MAEVTRRKLLAAGAAGAGAVPLPTGWPAVARAGSAAPPQVLAANGLALWYDEPAGADWLRALPIGNGRLGAMVFGNVDTACGVPLLSQACDLGCVAYCVSDGVQKLSAFKIQGAIPERVQTA